MPSAKSLILNLLLNTLMFGVFALVLWGVEYLFARKGRVLAPLPNRMTLPSALKETFYRLPMMFVIAFALSFAMNIAAKALGMELPEQELVQWLKSGAYPFWVNVLVVIFAMFEAPILEEIIFRRYLFRVLNIRLPLLWACVASGIVFAAIHGNLLVLVPLAFLGYSFADIYQRTGRLAAAMTAHFAFNALNALLIFILPESVA